MWPVYGQLRYVGYWHSFSQIALVVTRLMRSAFPDCESQRDTKGQKETFYVGVERQMATPVSTTATISLEAQLSFRDAQIKILTARVKELEAEVHSLRQSLMAQQSLGCSSVYKDELSSLISSNSMLTDGPTTILRAITLLVNGFTFK